MILEPHDLFHEFPEYKEQIEALKTSDEKFARMCDEYHEVNKHVQTIELDEEIATDFELEDLKKQRLHLKDELYGILRTVTGAS
ncbi:MAG: DUF465 domain-containing protein [Thauera phenolivorans]|uniref:DUF465 domain-containing protein n=1 Tax=Thauera phenolivorans TaxID=1792543 RepID=A0A7X7R6N9_9RHOO|nr:DUF465 domain-containing protein [Thauera phenolivorans]NLF52887.1 DUF465 domain-containing protein [Thauera phenolivorans]